LRSINLEVSDKLIVSELIKLSIDKLNSIFEDEQLTFRLSPEYVSYNLKPSKKNGFAKMDYPCNFYLILGVNKDITIESSQVSQFTLIYDDKLVKLIQGKQKCLSCILM
jgi:hypothetical protein